jgi:hypothetical protein
MAVDINDTPNRVRYTATAAQTVFSVPFQFLTAADLKLYQNGTLKTLSTHYTVTGAGASSGTVTLVSGAALSDDILIVRDMPVQRIGDFPVSGPFDVASLNDQLDAQTMMVRDMETRIDRRLLRQPVADLPETLSDIPAKAARANLYLGFDANGQPKADLPNAAVITDYGDRIEDLETISGGLSAVGTVADNIASINTVVTNIGDIQTVAGNIVDVSNFADVYYGPSASNPTTRKDSSALQTGDLYFNTVDKEIRVWGGSSWQSGAAAAISVQQFSGNGSTTAFTLSLSTSSENNTQVYVSGVYRQKDAYSVSGTTLTFATAPASGTNNIEVVTINSLALGQINASLVNVTDAGGYYAGTNVESVLQDIGGLVNPTTSKVTAKRFEGIATDDAGTPDAIFRVNRTHTAATAPHAFRDQTAFNPASAGIAAASFDAQMVSGGTQNMNHTIGFQARNEHAGSGTLTDMFGYGFYPRVSAGTVTNCIGMDINGFSGAGSVTNYYGLYVRNITNTVSGQKYAIYVAGNLAKSLIGSSTQFVGEGIVSVGNAAKIFIGDGGNGYKSIAYNHNMNTNTYDVTDKTQSMYFGGSDITFRWAASGTAGATPSFTNLINIKTDAATNPGALYPAANGTQKLGISGLGWSEVFASNGTINTSDARVKTDVRDLTDAELAAAKQLAREIGVFKFLDAITKKGDAARSHIGMTVQRVIEIMQSHGLDAMTYGFVCYDQWDDEFEDHPASYERVIVEPEQVEETPAHVVDVRETVLINGEAVEVVRQVEVPAHRRVIKDAVIGDGPVRQEAWREHKVVAGDSYGFRTDQLLLFISRGFEARLSALEAI